MSKLCAPMDGTLLEKLVISFVHPAKCEHNCQLAKTHTHTKDFVRSKWEIAQLSQKSIQQTAHQKKIQIFWMTQNNQENINNSLLSQLLIKKDSSEVFCSTSGRSTVYLNNYCNFPPDSWVGWINYHSGAWLLFRLIIHPGTVFWYMSSVFFLLLKWSVLSHLSLSGLFVQALTAKNKKVHK